MGTIVQNSCACPARAPGSIIWVFEASVMFIFLVKY
jgi:hypothetical protein